MTRSAQLLPFFLFLALLVWTSEARSEPLEGADKFVSELEDCAQAILGGDRAARTPEIAVAYNRAKEARRKGVDQAGQEEAERLRAEADRMLLKLFEDFEGGREVRISDSGPAMDLTPTIRVRSDPEPVLLRVSAGEGPTSFAVADADLWAHAVTLPLLEIPYHPPGTTWVLLLLRNAPSGRNAQEVRFKSNEDPPKTWVAGFPIEASPWGRVQVHILDETGTPVPAMVRLTSRKTGQTRKPSGAVLFDEQVDIPAHGRPSFDGAHSANLPGEWKGRYWVLPGPGETALPPGEWEIHVRRGFEFVPLHEAFTVESGRVTEKRLTLKRWIDMPALGWYSGDDHIHSRIQDDADAERLMAWVRAEDVHVANVLRMGDHLRVYYEQRGFGPEFRVQEGSYALVPGQEDPRYFMGHALGLNLTAPVRDEKRYLLNDWIADTIHAQGGLYGHCHLANNLFDIERDLALLMPEGKSDFGEILQFRKLGIKQYYDALDLGWKLAASAGSDTPYGSSLGENRVYAYVGTEGFSVDAWFEGLRRGRTFVTNGPMLDLRVDQALPGDTVASKENRALPVRAIARGIPLGSAPRTLRLVCHGEVVASATSENPDQAELQLNLELPVEYGFWIAAQVEGWDQSVGHTTPVYVAREGYRFWNFQRAREIIAHYQRVLANLEGILTHLHDQDRAGKVSKMDFVNQGLLFGAPEVLERVERARGHYNNLLAVHDAEAQSRAKGDRADE
ncbi:MAG: hypothetical protein GHCLOJNM_04546 [bacterium]|nr:hypothetical protein [bacterium]